ncbi:MAG TPA: sulfotransferase [Candidatus Dormibacteraeota bacterium]|nr:sulfotransferase [Candidatus Dormibacteraeota bacterium]
MTSDVRLLMLSAMYENGGNTTQRLLDGHPELLVYPFESQLGTRLVVDGLSSMFPVKYRWPVFALDATPEEDYRAVIDEECKVRARTPQVSKFRHVAFDFSDDERCAAYCRHVATSARTRGDNVAAFFRATFDAWKDYRRTDRQQVYVGYSPIVVVDADKILRDLPAAHVLHVVRNPWSAYADTKKRPLPLSLETYLLGWTLNQYYALLFQRLFPGRLHIVRIEDVIEDPVAALRPVCDALGVEAGASLRTPSWNGAALEEVYPWGTIRRATPEVNRATAAELAASEREQVRERARPYLELLDYASFPRR